MPSSRGSACAGRPAREQLGTPQATQEEEQHSRGPVSPERGQRPGPVLGSGSRAGTAESSRPHRAGGFDRRPAGRSERQVSDALERYRAEAGARDLSQGGLTRGGCPYRRSRYRQRRFRHASQSGSRPAGSPGWPAAPRSSTSTTRRWCCPPPRRRSSPRKSSTSSRSPWTWRSGCTRRAGSPARSSAARAARPRTRSSPAGSSTGRCARRFVKGLRNEVQIVVDDHGAQPGPPVRRGRDQRRVAVHPAAGLPFSGPIGGVRVALIKGAVGRLPDALPARGRDLRHGRRGPGGRGRRRRDHDGRGRGHRRARCADRRAGRRRRRPRRWSPQGLEAAKPFIKQLCEAQQQVAAQAAKDDRGVPDLPDYEPRRPRRRRRRGRPTSWRRL